MNGICRAALLVPISVVIAGIHEAAPCGEAETEAGVEQPSCSQSLPKDDPSAAAVKGMSLLQAGTTRAARVVARPRAAEEDTASEPVFWEDREGRQQQGQWQQGSQAAAGVGAGAPSEASKSPTQLEANTSGVQKDETSQTKKTQELELGRAVRETLDSLSKGRMGTTLRLARGKMTELGVGSVALCIVAVCLLGLTCVGVFWVISGGSSPLNTSGTAQQAFLDPGAWPKLGAGAKSSRRLPDLSVRTKITTPQASSADLSKAMIPPAEGGYLCAELVVPSNCECVLLVPMKPLGEHPFEITDTHRSPVLFVVAAGQPSRFVLSANDGLRLALFGAAESPNARSRSPPGRGRTSTGPATPALSLQGDFELQRPNGDHFARLTRGPTRERFTLVTHAGVRLHFWGQKSVNVTDDEDQLVATTEQSSEVRCPGVSPESESHQCCLLRVAPLTDVGLVLCGVLCVQHLARESVSRV